MGGLSFLVSKQPAVDLRLRNKSSWRMVIGYPDSGVPVARSLLSTGS